MLAIGTFSDVSLSANVRRQQRSFHGPSLRELLEPALRDFYEAAGAPRQIPFGSDSRVQIAN
jgi:hypothetical protein